MLSRTTVHAFALLSLVAASQAIAEWEKTYEFEGNTRRVLLCEGAKASFGSKPPLIMVFHGYGGNAESIREGFKFEELWLEALVVYVQGLVIPERDDGRIEPGKEGPGWQRRVGQDGDRDLTFVDFLVERLAADCNIDRERVYAAGFSNGARFTWVLLAARPGTFAAFAPVAHYDSAVLEAATVPKPVIFHFGKMEKGYKSGAPMKTIRRMKRLNRSTGEGQEWAEGYTLFESAEGGAPFVLNLHERGHEVPSYAPEHIVRFFKSCRNAQPANE